MKKFLLLLTLSASIQIFAAGDKDIVHYKVIKHDNIFRISLVYNSTQEDIMAANPGVDPHRLIPGSILEVPQNTKIRDAAFVMAMLNGHMPVATEAPVAVAKEAVKEPVKEAVKEVTKPQPAAVQTPKMEQPSPKMEEEKPFAVPMTEDENPFVAPATKKAEAPAIAPETEDENPFSTAVTKKVQVSTPAEAPATGDENPFVVPAKKEAPADTKTEASPASKVTNTTSSIQAPADVNTTVVEKVKVDPTANTYKDSAKELNTAINTKMVTVLNLQVVLKDGSVRTYTNPDDQKRVLTQLASGTPLE
jgi:hypothetical protein